MYTCYNKRKKHGGTNMKKSMTFRLGEESIALIQAMMDQSSADTFTKQLEWAIQGYAYQVLSDEKIDDIYKKIRVKGV